MTLFDLSGKKALITGASRGIGQEIAVAFAEAGADLALVARSEDGLATTAEKAAGYGHEAFAIRADVTDQEAVEGAVAAAIERLGRIDFWRLAIKPGRPVALGQVKGVPLIGLPGNPVAAALTFAVLARPLILRLAGAAAEPPLLFRVAAGFAYRKKAGRREYLRASLERDGGSLIARRYPKDGAGILSSIVQSDGFVVLDETVSDLARGAPVDFLPFSEVIG